MIRSAVFYAGNSILLLQFFSADVAEYIHAVWFIKNTEKSVMDKTEKGMIVHHLCHTVLKVACLTLVFLIYTHVL